MMEIAAAFAVRSQGARQHIPAQVNILFSLQPRMDPSLATAADLARACGQVVAIIPNDRVPDCAIVIDPPESAR